MTAAVVADEVSRQGPADVMFGCDSLGTAEMERGGVFSSTGAHRGLLEFALLVRAHAGSSGSKRVRETPNLSSSSGI